MKNKFLIVIVVIIIPVLLFAQEDYRTILVKDSLIYLGGESYHVKTYEEPTKYKRPKNIILMIGDGMGVAQIYAGLTANRGTLNISNFKNIGFQTSYSYDKFVTDSGAGGTALSCGQKTYNGAIGVNIDTVAIENIREKMELRGMATGVVSTSAVTHATPASFVAHQPNRSKYEAIAADYLKTNIDVFIGGGYDHFTDRKDSLDLTIDLEAKGYKVLTDINEIEKVKNGKLAGLLAPKHLTKIIEGRGDMLVKATKTALNILDNDPQGFFVMIEGSQIDWGGHQNNTTYIITEVLDFDQAIGQALEFAVKDKETLVIVTADHETGGFGILDGNMQTGEVEGAFTCGDHTGVMVPVFAFGPGSEKFRGFYDNTDIPQKIMQLLAK